MILVGTFLLLSTFFASASSILDINEDGLITDASCVGDNVDFYAVDTKMMWKLGTGIALATKEAETLRNVVLVNKQFFPKIPPPAQYFIIQHECAHHELNHMQTQSEFDGDLANTNEQIADCYAARKVLKHFTPKHFNILYEFMLDQEFSAEAGAGAVPQKYIAEAHSWTPEDRVNRLKQCIMDIKNETNNKDKRTI